MSRLFEALRRSEQERVGRDSVEPGPPGLPSDLLQTVEKESFGFEEVRSLPPAPRPLSRLVTLTQERSLGAEKFRLLATRLKHLQERRQVKKVLVSSSITEEGKSLVAANLAVALSKGTQQKVLLLEGDLRHPALASLLGVNPPRGLSEWLQAEEPATKFFYRLAGLRLWFLPAGVSPEQPLELLQSARLGEIMNQLAGWFDWIIIDAPPLLPLADANSWARLSDGVLLVVREGKTPKKFLQKALESVDNLRLLGAVLNESTVQEHSYYDYYAGRTAGKNGRPSGKKNGPAT